MTKFQKQMLTIAAAGALSAVTALPAMAFENEFHGLYRLRWFNSNVEQYGAGALYSTNKYVSNPAGNTTSNLKNNNYFEQRARIFYTAKASDDLMLKTAFELDAAWGSNSQSAASAQYLGNFGRNQGGSLDTDAVSLETKHVYLDFKIPSTPTRVAAGLQAFKDNIKGVFMDFDGAGIKTSTNFGPVTLGATYIRGYDNMLFSSAPKYNTLGNEDVDIAAVEMMYKPTKDSNFGLVYYLYNDGRAKTISGSTGSATATPATSFGTYTTADKGTSVIHTIGLTGEGKLGPVTLSGFAAYQGGIFKAKSGATGTTAGSTYLNALAYNVAAKAKVGPGNLRTALLFTSGNDQNASEGKSKHLTGWVGVAQSSGGNWQGGALALNDYNESGMMLLNRNVLAQTGTTDYSIVFNSGNGTTPQNSQGVYLYSLGYDATVSEKMFINSNVGFAWAAHNNNLKPWDRKTGKQNATNFMGTEINTEIGYKMYPNLTAYVGGAYVILGGYYKGSADTTGITGTPTKDPDNPYTARMTLIYSF